MVDSLQPSIYLDHSETGIVIPMDTYTTGTIKQFVQTRDNSALSSIYIKSASVGATIQLNYYDYTTGEQFGERYDLDAHPPLTDADVGDTNRIIVTKIHNRTIAELIITGTVECGVLLTSVSTFASDLDNALINDGDTFVQTQSLAIPMACYDEASGKLRFIRCVDGAFIVSPDTPGDAVFHDSTVASVPATETDIISATVPALKIRRFAALSASCSQSGIFRVKIGGTVIGTQRTGPGSYNININWTARRIAVAAETYKVTFEQTIGSNACDVDAHLQVNELDA